MFVNVGRKVYTFYDHAVKRMHERNITFEQVEATMLEPDSTTELPLGRTLYERVIENHAIGVVVDEGTSEIVTVWQDGEDD